MPETVLLEMRERIGKEAEVARHKCFDAKNDLRKSGKNQQREENPKTHRREDFPGEGRVAVRLHAQIKASTSPKCNCAQLTLSLTSLTLS